MNAFSLNQLRHRLIVSCQPTQGGPMDNVQAVLGFAGAALQGGAAGLRIEGADHVRAVCACHDVPVIGLIKRDLSHSPVRITPYLEDVKALSSAGAHIIAVDGTQRDRPAEVAELIACIHAHGCLAMADCACFEEARLAVNWGADLVGSTMSGYTGGEVPHQPDLSLVKAMRQLSAFVVAEGRIHSPSQLAQAVLAGADAVVVGTAITRPDVVTSWFARAMDDVCETS